MGKIHCKGQNIRNKRRRKIAAEKIKTRMERILAAILKPFTSKEN